MSLLDPGDYQATIVAARVAESGNGNPLLEVELSVHGEYDPGEDVPNPCGPYKRTMKMSLHGGARQYTIADLKRVEFNFDWRAPGFASDEHRVECIHEEGESRDFEKWRFPRRSPNAGKSALDALEEMTAKMASEGKITVGPPKERTAVEKKEDDDLPF